MPLFDDTRNGLGYTKTFQIQYEGLKNIGKNEEGIDKFIYFEQVPWVLIKTTWQKIAEESFWKTKIEEMKTDYERLAISNTGVFIDSVNVGEKLIIDGIEHFAGSYSETDYRNGVGNFPAIYNLFEWSGGQASPAGFWDDNSRSNFHGQAFFNSPVFGEIANKTYTAEIAEDTIGEKKTIAGVDGIVSSVSKSNPRLINNKLVYDFSVQLSAQKGSSISVQ